MSMYSYCMFTYLHRASWHSSLPWLRFFRYFSSVVRQILGYNPQGRGTARTFPNFCVVLYCFCVVLCIVCVYMCIVLLAPGGYPIAVKYIISDTATCYGCPLQPSSGTTWFTKRVKWEIGTLHWHNPSGCNTALGYTQPLTEISARNISWGGKGGRCGGLTLKPPWTDCL